MGAWAPTLAAVALLTACSQPFACEDDSQCSGSVDGGVCESNGYCSFPDGDCPSGRRYGELSGGGLAGLCVVDDDATTGMTTSTSTTVTTGPLPLTSTSVPPNTSQPVDMDTGSSTTDDSAPMTGSSSESGSSSSTGNEIDPDLLLWLPFEEDIPAAAGAVDASGNGHFAGCGPGGCPTMTAGRVGMAALFDGIDDVLVPAYDSAFDLGEFTVALWVRLDAAPMQFASAMGKAWSDGSLNSYEIYYSAENQILLLGMDAGTGAVVTYDYVPADGWIHVAGTFDGSEFRMHVNGETTGVAIAPNPPEYDDHPITLGADDDQEMLQAFWEGALDDVRIYSRALTLAEVQALASM